MIVKRSVGVWTRGMGTATESEDAVTCDRMGWYFGVRRRNVSSVDGGSCAELGRMTSWRIVGTTGSASGRLPQDMTADISLVDGINHTPWEGTT